MKPRPACPHTEIVYCPLYAAAHTSGSLGCDDGKLILGECAVSRGLDYPAAVARLPARVVAILRFREAAAAASAQRNRNMRALGLH